MIVDKLFVALLDAPLAPCQGQPMANKTAQQQLATVLLGKPVMTYINLKRRSGTSWREISRDLFLDTEGKVSVSDTTLKRWVQK